MPWGDLGCDVVLECTGQFRKADQLRGYLERGAGAVVVAAPVKDGALNVVVGVNDNRVEPRAQPMKNSACHAKGLKNQPPPLQLGRFTSASRTTT